MMSKYQKRLSAPKQYPVTRSEGKYVVAAQGPHPGEAGLPLVVVLRDVLSYAADRKDVKRVLSQGDVLVNGREQRNPRFTVGFMDVVSFPRIDEHYRVLLTRTGFVLTAIDEDDAGRKLAQVADKTTQKNGVTQLNLDDGNNIQISDDYATRSSVLVTLPDLEIEAEIPFAEGNLAYVTGGQHAGTIATVTTIEERTGMHPQHVVLETGDGDTIETVAENVYMIGTNEPEVDIDATA